MKAMIFYLSEARKEFADGELNENSKTEMFRAYKWLCTGDEWAHVLKESKRVYDEKYA